MSEPQAAGALIAAVALVVGLLISQALERWREREREKARRVERREERKEWYQRTLFEKRVQAVQEAYAWLNRLNRAIAEATPGDDPRGEQSDELVRLAREARDFYDANTLLLFSGSPGSSSFVGLTNAALSYARGKKPSEIQRHLMDAWTEVGAISDRLFASEGTGRRDDE